MDATGYYMLEETFQSADIELVTRGERRDEGGDDSVVRGSWHGEVWGVWGRG